MVCNESKDPVLQALLLGKPDKWHSPRSPRASWSYHSLCVIMYGKHLDDIHQKSSISHYIGCIHCSLFITWHIEAEIKWPPFPDDIFKCIFLNENVWYSIKIPLICFPKVPINNISTLVQIMAWSRAGDKSLSGTMMVNLLTHICVTRPQWVKPCFNIIRHKHRIKFIGEYKWMYLDKGKHVFTYIYIYSVMMHYIVECITKIALPDPFLLFKSCGIKILQIRILNR